MPGAPIALATFGRRRFMGLDLAASLKESPGTQPGPTPRQPRCASVKFSEALCRLISKPPSDGHAHFATNRTR